MNKLKKLREENLLTRSEIAVAVGITTSYYGMLELGVRTPSLSTAAKLAEYFKLPIEEIFFKFKTTESCFGREVL